MISQPIRILSFVACVVAAGPASALSCAAPTVDRAYGRAADSPADYLIVAGSMDLTGQSTPPEGAVALNGDINNMQGYTQPAQVRGNVFTGSGFTQTWQGDVLVEVGCTIAWCGQAARVNDGLFFIRRNADGSYALEVDACPLFVLTAPTNADLQQVQTCYSNGGC